ncbi:MAG: coenzyme F420-0:L-glutamate ligase [Fusobacterium sp. JB021]|nr:coenzyme F420-0:L-glutamate ligase [Fusobacterium sp. JB020]MDP0493908.1 coenzyme F420-0:L-glutamate ligase [Fusobacterium sp. JB021]MDP0506193.1 coenzyme F420-0:L-glutamate ligase [Fusobacterium sp. JB019]
MGRLVGTISRGLRAPIIHQGDDISKFVVNSVMKAVKNDNIQLKDRDIVAITESIVARAQGNYASIDNIAQDVEAKYGDKTIGVIFPILSRNRFSVCLKGIARKAKKIVLMFSYPSDEVGNHFVDYDLLDEKGVNPWSDVLTEKEFTNKFGKPFHIFTGVNYIDYYSSIIKEEGTEVEVIFANNPISILKYTDYVLNCDIHTRLRTKKLLRKAGAKIVYGLDDILKKSINGSGYNENYGLLGTNKATDYTVKLFPRDCRTIVNKIQKDLLEKTGKHIEVMIFGDGAFKDPIGKIWELADPVVSPGYTDGLEGKPNEIKLKYLADNDLSNLKGEDLQKAIKEAIKSKEKDLKGKMITQGTTPRRLTDLIGSLCDLTTGSGDKGTPIVLIQGYFDNYIDD